MRYYSSKGMGKNILYGKISVECIRRSCFQAQKPPNNSEHEAAQYSSISNLLMKTCIDVISTLTLEFSHHSNSEIRICTTLRCCSGPHIIRILYKDVG